MRSPPARALTDYFFKDYKPSAMECEACLRGRKRRNYSTIICPRRSPPTPRRRFQGAGSLGSPCIPSLVSGFRTPKHPLLPLWEKGGRGDEGSKHAREYPRISPRNSPLEHTRGRDARAPGANLPVRTSWHGQVVWTAPASSLPFQASGCPNAPFSPCGRRGLGGWGVQSARECWLAPFHLITSGR